MKPRSAKNKGARLQKYLAEFLRNFLVTDCGWDEREAENDIKPAIMGESGEDIKMSTAAREMIPYSFECKNTEKINIWAAIKQAEENAPDGTIPAVVFKRNRSKVYITVELSHFSDFNESR